MSCNTCPLLEICSTNLEMERESGLNAVEKHYQSVQDGRQLEWLALADGLPSNPDKDNFIADIDKRLLIVESAIISSEEVMDRIEYSLNKSVYSPWLTNDQLTRDEVACPGPENIHKLRSVGKKALICSSQSRIKRAEDYNKRSDGSQD